MTEREGAGGVNSIWDFGLGFGIADCGLRIADWGGFDLCGGLGGFVPG
jgi:hypothetical protein